MPRLHFVGFVFIPLNSYVAFSRFEDLFGGQDLWKFLLHVKGLLGFSAFPPMTTGQCQLLQASLRFALDFGALGRRAIYKVVTILLEFIFLRYVG